MKVCSANKFPKSFRIFGKDTTLKRHKNKAVTRQVEFGREELSCNNVLACFIVRWSQRLGFFKPKTQHNNVSNGIKRIGIFHNDNLR